MSNPPDPEPRSGAPSGIDRRRFLRHAGVGLGAASLAPGVFSSLACSSSTSGGAPGGAGATGPGTTAARARLLDLPASSAPIDHVVVLMLENRSFDHWLGWLGSDEAYLEAGRRRYGNDFAIEASLRETYRGATGDVTTAPMAQMLPGENIYRGCGHPDPGHGWRAGRAQRDTGFLGTGSGNDQFALGYFQGAELPFTAQFAKRFMVCDRSFASVLGPTYPNREYLLSGQSGGNKSNAFPTADGWQWDCIFDRLSKANVPVRSYYPDLPASALFGPRVLPMVSKIERYFEDCKAGTLPAVSFVDPAFLTGARTDNHPHGDIRAGEAFARDVFAAFARSRHWERGLFILTYDEWGGFYDHVRPPILADDRTSADDQENFAQAGFRVPTVLASPHVAAGSVDHTVYDHTSILRFIEWRFLGAPAHGPGGGAEWSLTSRDRNANNIATALLADANRDLGLDLDVAVAPPSSDCDIPVAKGAAYAGDKHSFELALDEGYFESVGADVEPSSMTKDWVLA